MKVVVCLDDRLGMTFGGRRQSRDRVLIADLCRDVSKGERLLASEYSSILFDGMEVRPIYCEDFLNIAEKGDVCFVEDRALAPFIDRIDSLVIYRWNRHYPSDMTFDIDPDREGFELVKICEFAGSSHEKITKEIYER